MQKDTLGTEVETGKYIFNDIKDTVAVSDSRHWKVGCEEGSNNKNGPFTIVSKFYYFTSYRLFVLPLILVFVVLFFSCSKLDISGIYKGKITDPSGKDTNSIDVEITLIHKEKDLTGTFMLYQKGVAVNTLEIKSGIVEDRKIIFFAKGSLGFVQLKFDGKLVDDVLEGEVTLSAMKVHLSAKKNLRF